MTNRSSHGNLVFFAWWLPCAAFAFLTAEALHAAVGLTSWPLVDVTFGLAALISAVALRAFGRTLLEAIAITGISLVPLGLLFLLYAHSVSNNLN
jgi:hypothetical protein